MSNRRKGPRLDPDAPVHIGIRQADGRVRWAGRAGQFPNGKPAVDWSALNDRRAAAEFTRREALSIHKRVELEEGQEVVIVPLGPNILALGDELGLRPISYLRQTTEDGRFWLPRDVIGTDGKSLIIYREACCGGYSFAGWETWHDGDHGGRHRTYAAALGWFQWLAKQRARPCDSTRP